MMKGIYLNVDTQVADNAAHLPDDLYHLPLAEYGIDGKIIYSATEWQSKPVLMMDGTLMAVSGWFVFNGQLNNLDALLEAYLSRGREVFNEIEIGNFVILVSKQGTYFVVNDLVGLSTHYWTKLNDQKGIMLAPSLSEIADYRECDAVYQSIVEAQGHLFDDFTCLKDTYRLTPGSLLEESGEIKVYCDMPEPVREVDLSSVPQLIGDVVNKWPKERRALAISGGLDSRLMLASSSYTFGYTYGPTNSGDRVIARVFSDCFERYYEYSIQDALTNAKRTSKECEYYFNYSSEWINGLMEAYDTARAEARDADVLFDGYLGDVFQRGNYIRFGGALGSMLKMFPFLYKLPMSARYILRKRYKKLNDEQFQLLMESFEKRTSHLDLDAYQKVTYYELFFGRGGRYVINGGNVTANQLFTVVPVFMSRSMLGLLLRSNLYDAVCFKNVGKVWLSISNEYKEVRADSGISPNTSPWLAPFVNVGYRFLLHYAPWMSNYGDELKKIKLKP